MNKIFLIMASLQVLFALAFVCLAGQASATLKDHCSDVSFWDVVKYKTSSRQCCTPAELKQTCVWKNENVCKDVTELKCEVSTIAFKKLFFVYLKSLLFSQLPGLNVKRRRLPSTARSARLSTRTTTSTSITSTYFSL